MQRLTSKQRGFTIVELLIVIVVIAILAAITIVAYNGIQNRAKASAAQTAASQAARKVVAWSVRNGETCPADLAEAEVTNTDGLEYSKDLNSSPCKFGITATSGGVSYFVTNDSASPQPGVAATTNLIPNPSFENNVAGWSQFNSMTISRSTTRQQSGAAAMLVATRSTTTDDFASMNISVEVGVPYVVSAWIYLGANGATSANRHLWLYNQAGGAAAVDIDYPAPGAWRRISGTITPTNSTLTIRIHSVTGAAMFVDSMMITKGTTLYNYADGDTLNWTWTGTPGNSTSTGRPTAS